MAKKRIIGSVALAGAVSQTLLGGTGRPQDGFLSFILLFGFLVLLLGIIQLLSFLKRKILELLEDIY